MDNEVIATVQASQPRRWLGVSMLVALGLLLIYLGVSAQSSAVIAKAAFLVFGGLCLWMAENLRRATEHGIELTDAGLRETTGAIIAPIDSIRAVDRGFMAFKPSNGFVVTLEAPGERAWRPGVWWRMGKRIGVGGVTAASQTRFMADALKALLVERDGT